MTIAKPFLAASIYLVALSFTTIVNAADNTAAAPSLDKLTICTSCHGPTGISAMPPIPGSIVPHLAGQYADYLVKALRDYRSGARQHAVMAGMAAGLTDAEIDSLAAYYAGQEGLTVVKKP